MQALKTLKRFLYAFIKLLHLMLNPCWAQDKSYIQHMIKTSILIENHKFPARFMGNLHAHHWYCLSHHFTKKLLLFFSFHFLEEKKKMVIMSSSWMMKSIFNVYKLLPSLVLSHICFLKLRIVDRMKLLIVPNFHLQ